jgi:hypothetical protein
MKIIKREGQTFLTSIHETAFVYASTLQPHHSSITPHLAEVWQDFTSTITALLVIITAGYLILQTYHVTSATLIIINDRSWNTVCQDHVF